MSIFEDYQEPRTRQSYSYPRLKHYRDPDRYLDTWGWVKGILSLLFLLAIFVGWPVVSLISAHSNNTTQTIFITRADDQSTSKGHQYLLFTPGEVFKDTDNFWLGKWNSSDLFNQLTAHENGSGQIGAWFTCRINGQRSHITSNYRNLISCTGPIARPAPPGYQS